MKHRLKTVARRLLPRRIKSHRIWSGLLRGQRIVTSWHDYPSAILGYNERHLIDWFAENVSLGETWLDIGAHYGYTAMALCKLVGSEGRVFAFEPMLSTAGCIQETRRLNQLSQLTVIPVALAAPPELSLESLSTERGMIDGIIMPLAWQEDFLVARLDWLWASICAKEHRVDGVKIDVQGMEVKTLQGMSKLLTQHRPRLVIEFHRNVDRELLLDIVEESGYRRKGVPIKAAEDRAHYLDNRSYVFGKSA